VNLVRENLNQELKIEGILLTMADYRTNLTGEVIAEVRKYFADMANAGGATHRVYDTVIPRNIRLTEAPGFGKPIAFYDNNSAGALKYLEFANEIMGIKSAKNDKGTQNTNVNGEQS
jgi:chromosome partitioning protein